MKDRVGDLLNRGEGSSDLEFHQECYNHYTYKNKLTPEPQKLPPTQDALLCHCKRVACVIAVVKKSLERNVCYPSYWMIKAG